MRSIISLSLLLLSGSSIADTNFQNRAIDNYNRMSNQAKVFCRIPKESKKVNIKFISNKFDNNFLNTNYMFNGHETQFIINAKSLRTQIKFKNQNYSAIIEKRMINIINGPQLFKNLQCKIEIGLEETTIIRRSPVHVNVHPHQIYDPQEEIGKKVEERLMKNYPEQYVLLDYNPNSKRDPNLKDFFSGKNRDFKFNRNTVSNITFSNKIPILVSPSGENIYSYSLESLTVDFTGGNHNHCMWYNTRAMVNALLALDSNKELTLNYYVDEIVLARKGVISLGRRNRPIDVSRKEYSNGRQFTKILNSMTPFRVENYHWGFYQSMEYNLNYNLNNMFATTIINYNSQGYNNSVKVHGTGTGEYIINMNYIY